VRKVVAILSLAALALAGTASAGPNKEQRKQEQKLARVMALAEADFAMRRAELGLVGSTLGSESQAFDAQGRLVPLKAEALGAPATPVAASPAAGDGSLR